MPVHRHGFVIGAQRSQRLMPEDEHDLRWVLPVAVAVSGCSMALIFFALARILAAVP